MINWNERTVKVDDLSPFERNPRKISESQYKKLVSSLKENGYHQRILATQDLRVIGGHQRKRALKELGINEIAVLTPDRELSDEEFKRLLIQDNIPFGEFDFAMLASDFDAKDLADWGMPEDWLKKIPQKSETGHSTQKPVECMKRPILNNSSEGQAIYEPFSGSGTTMIACEQTGRHCFAIELNPAYVDMAVERWSRFSGKSATLESTGEAFPLKEKQNVSPIGNGE